MGIILNVASECDRLGSILEKVVNGSSVAARALSGCEFSIGPAKDSRFGVPATAQDAVFVGDSAWIEKDPICDAATKALFERDPSKVSVRPVYNPVTQKWSMKFQTMAGDALDMIGGQLFSPWNISYMAKIFREPLAYSNVDQYVHYDQGSNPWAELYTLFLEQYSGWAMAGQTGSLQNIMTSDVNVKDGMMSAPVINISGTYSLTLEEQVRGNAGSPFGQAPMARKQSYLNYAMNMLKAYIAIYGNEETNTDGFAQVNPIEIWSLANSIKALSTGPQPGYNIYRMLANLINERITISDGKFKNFKFVMSPEALAILRSTPYSEIYDPTAAMKIFMNNYDAQNKEGQVPSVQFISEPLLKANSIFNPTSADYSMLICDEVGGGPTDESQPTMVFGAPLQSFVFPAIPGQYNTQYKSLARLAGIIAPVPAGIRMFQGLGVQS